MASSEAEVANSALDKIGEAPISSLNDKNKRAELMKRQYPLQRDYLLRTKRWKFAKARVQLAATLPAPPFGFTGKFLLPVDCIAVRGIFDANEPLHNETSARISYTVEEGRFLHAHGSLVNLIYTKRVTDVSSFDPTFVDALAGLLAWKTAYALTGSKELAADMNRAYLQALRDASVANAIEGPPEEIIASEWVDARYDVGTGPFRLSTALY